MTEWADWIPVCPLLIEEHVMLSVTLFLRALGPETARQISCYKGESPFAVARRAVRMMSMADGHLTPDGRVKVSRGHTKGKQ